MHGTGGFSIKEITKVEGHANLLVEMQDNKVKKCELQIFEGQRFFEQMLAGRHYSEVPLIVSRICGLCNISHLNTSMEAVEKAFGVKASDQTIALREIATNAEFLKSHALHLFFLALPDYLGKESALDLDESQHKYLHWGMNLKKAGTDLARLLGGRAYHAVSIRPGNFTILPTQQQLEKAVPMLEKQRQTAIDTVKLFASLSEQLPFERKTEYLALSSSEYSLTEGKLLCSSGAPFGEEEMLQHVQEFSVPYSGAKEAMLGKKESRVGALARINLNQKALQPGAKDLMREEGLRFPSNRIYHNNTAQAIEMLHLIDRTIALIKSTGLKKEPMQEIKPTAARGIGVTEAPRGTLYHDYEFDQKGFLTRANIVVPTNQNARPIESDLIEFIPTLLQLPQEKANIEIEKVIRAYDPCISCATHFLKVNWTKH